MEIKQIANIDFLDDDSGEQCGIVVRSYAGGLIIAMYLESDGDIEVSMPIDKVKVLYEAIEQGIKHAESQ